MQRFILREYWFLYQKVLDIKDTAYMNALISKNYNKISMDIKKKANDNTHNNKT